MGGADRGKVIPAGPARAGSSCFDSKAADNRPATPYVVKLFRRDFEDFAYVFIIRKTHILLQIIVVQKELNVCQIKDL